MVAPTLTLEQRRAAQAASLAVRRVRADIKRHITAADLPVETLRRYWHDESVRGMKVYDLLRALPGVGAQRAMSLLAEAGIPIHNTVRRCGRLQTERLFSLLQS